MFRLLILRKMKSRPAAGGLGPGPRSGRQRAMGVPILLAAEWSEAQRRRRQNWGHRRSLTQPVRRRMLGLAERIFLLSDALGDDFVPETGAEKAKKAPRSEEHTSELQSLMRISY